MSSIEVVAGVLVLPGTDFAPDRVLLQQRPASKDFPLRWECPGGKVASNHESHHSALARELREELGIVVGPHPDRRVADFHISQNSIWCGYVGSEDHGRVFILFYRVFSWSGPIAPKEGQGWGWFGKAEVDALWKTPGNVEARRALSAAIWGG